MHLRPSPSELIHEEQTKEARERFEHVVIDLKSQHSKSGEVAAAVASKVIQESSPLPPPLPHPYRPPRQQQAQVVPQQGRRRSSLQWITGKVEQLRRKFSATTEAQQEESGSFTSPPPLATSSFPSNSKTSTPLHRKKAFPLSPSDAMFLQICQKYRRCAENKYCILDFAFDDLISQFSALLAEEDIELAEGDDELPRGALLFPLSEATGLSILDFEQVGGYSLGRNSKIVQRGKEIVSRSHCLIFLDRNGLAVKDCDSHTGTFVCGRLIGSGASVPLVNFDIVQLGYSQRGPQETVQFLVVLLRNWNSRKFGEEMHSVASPISLAQSPTKSGSMLEMPQVLPKAPEKRQARTTEEREPVSMESFCLAPQAAPNVERPASSFAAKTSPQSSLVTSPGQPKTIQSSPRRPIESPLQNSPLNPSSPPCSSSTSTQMLPTQANSSPMKSSQISPIISPWSIATQPEFFEPSRPGTPQLQNHSTTSSPTLTEIDGRNTHSSKLIQPLDEAACLTALPTPPMRPKPRVLKKNLTKSYEELEAPAPAPATAQFTAKGPIEVPLILKAANVSEIPSISPITEWLLSVPSQAKQAHSLSIPVMEKRSERLQKMKKLAEFSTLPIGSSTVRFENFLDFGLFSSDISDGAARTWQGSAKESIKWAFHNYRQVWEVEGIDMKSGVKILFTARDSASRYYVSVAGGSCERPVPIGSFGIDTKKRMMARMVFNLSNDASFHKLTGIESSNSLEALHKLSFFYPHLRTPSLLIKGAPISPESSVHLHMEGPEDGQSALIGRLRFEKHRTTWAKHSMMWATDLDTAVLEAESLMTSLVHGAVLLYCLRYHLD